MSVERRDAYEAARGRWPRVALSFEKFCQHLDGLALPSLPPHIDAVFLCAACLAGDRAACRELDGAYLSRVRTSIARVRGNPDFVDEVLQRLRQALLIPPDAKLAKYTGRGSLEGWLRIVASREALDQVRWERGVQRRSARTVAHLIRLEPGVAFAKPESELAKRRHGPAFQRAVLEALQALPARDRGLLRLYFGQGFGIDVIGRMYRVHRATAARWIVRIRQRILAQVRARLEEELHGLAESDVASLVAHLRSDLGISLSGLLAPGPNGSGDEVGSS